MSNQSETANYIATLSEDLSRIAAEAGLNDLAGILVMAAMEARGGPENYIQPKQQMRRAMPRAA